MLRRQELLDKIKHEQITNEDYRRPRTYSARRRYTPSPLPPPSRRSLPELNRNYYANNNFIRGEQSYREPNTERGRVKDMSEVKHTIIHKVEPPPNILPAIQSNPQIPLIQQPPTQVIQQIPRPYIQNLVPENTSGFRMNKGDWMDMMMMQNHQMHQLVVQQMMLHSLPGGRHSHPPVTYMTEPAPVVVSERPSPAVHHHHYQMPPPSQPPVHHYTSLPPLEPRMISPMRVRTTLPGYYYYNEDGSNYYVYH